MHKNQFLPLQFNTLRDEIKQTQKRTYLLLALSALGVPPVQTIEFEIEALIFAIPIVIFAFIILFTEENAAMMRCGRYIRDYIETEVEGLVGWEQWLEQEGTQRRTSNVYFAICAYFVLFVHYLVAVSAAAQAAPTYGEGWQASLVLTYSGLGLWSVVFLWRNFRHAVSTI